MDNNNDRRSRIQLIEALRETLEITRDSFSKSDKYQTEDFENFSELLLETIDMLNDHHAEVYQIERDMIDLEIDKAALQKKLRKYEE